MVLVLDTLFNESTPTIEEMVAENQFERKTYQTTLEILNSSCYEQLLEFQFFIVNRLISTNMVISPKLFEFRCVSPSSVQNAQLVTVRFAQKSSKKLSKTRSTEQPSDVTRRQTESRGATRLFGSSRHRERHAVTRGAQFCLLEK